MSVPSLSMCLSNTHPFSVFRLTTAMLCKAYCVLCASVAQLQEAKNKVEEEKLAVVEERTAQLMLNKAEVS